MTKPTLFAKKFGIDDVAKYIQMSEGIMGWTRGEEAWELARVGYSLGPEAVIVEIGSFLGSGTVLLAGPRQVWGSGTVHAVDPFDCSGDSFSVPHYRQILAEKGGRPLRLLFDENISRAGLSQWVVAHEARASDAAKNWSAPVDMLFLDGDQSRAGAREAYDSWSPFLKSGGVIALHNSRPDNRKVDHDGHGRLVIEEILPPRYTDIRLVRSTTFARKT